jgi:glucosamine--fructose-6-phosphate aminotransferase (isomerizing)
MSGTLMFAEAGEAPQRVEILLRDNAGAASALAARLRKRPPRAVATLARGSSDNAATFARYLIETRLGVMTASSPPSVASVYGAAPDMAGTLCLAISQSGRSPDLVAGARTAAEAGALVVALTNEETSPLAMAAQAVLPLRAGAETSVAATKTFIAALAALAQLVALWGEDAELAAALPRLPQALRRAWNEDWSAALPRLLRAQHLYVVARGLGFAVAQEAALKFKETCGLHAEAFSTAEIAHGPMALVGPGFPVLAFSQSDETAAGVAEAMAAFAAQGAQVIATGPAALPAGAIGLPTAAGHPVLEPIAQIQSVYRMVDELAAWRGYDPDHPPHLAKVTETL